MKDDTISRQAVLKLLHALPPEESMTKALLIQGVKQMDAAQPEKRTEERTETHTCDLIDRRAAIEVADAVWSVTGDKNVAKVWDQIRNLPSAQPEQRWIPFAEHRPWEGQQILVCAEDGVMWMTVFRSRIGFSGAWLPLPEPYKEEE